VSTGWNCTDNTCNPICGDGILVGGENCDPGSDMLGKCTNNCFDVKFNYHCRGGDKTSESTCYSRHYYWLGTAAASVAFISTVLMSVSSFLVSGSMGTSVWIIVYSVQILRTTSIFAEE